MYPVVRNSVFPLQEQLQRIRRYLFLMTVFLHWTLRQMTVQLRKALKEKTKDASTVYRCTENQYDP